MASAAGSSGLSSSFHAKNRIASTTKLQNHQHFSPPNFLESHILLPSPMFSSMSCCSSTSSSSSSSFLNPSSPCMSIRTKNDQLLQLVDQQRKREVGNWNLIQKLAATILDNIEDNLIINMLEHDHPLPKTADPKIQIAGNFAPVAEQPIHHNLHVHGQIPPSIDGVYVRNGANPLFNPVAGHHFFDGDGMIHAISLKSGVATYACRFTETERFVQERAIGRPVFPKAIGELHGHSGNARLLLFYARGILGLIDNSRGTGVANASLVYFNNRLLAMSEDDLPYQVRITDHGDRKTVGRYDFDNQLQSSASMIAHPKVDPSTKEMFALSYDVVHKPYLKYFWFTPKGKKSEIVEIPLEQLTMMHDFAITKNFVVIPDQQLVFSLQEMIRGGSPVVFDEKKKSRFGIFPKYTSEVDNTTVKWIEVPDCFCFHLWNAWEADGNNDEGEIVVIGSCMTPPDSVFNECEQQITQSVLSEIRLNLRTGKSTRRPIILNSQTENQNQQQLNLEAGTVNKTLTGRKTQYAYLAIADPWPKVSGIAKVDLSSGQITKYMFGEGKFGGEPYFVSREPNLATTTNAHVKEDDGYILTFVHDERAAESKLLIANAVEMRLEAVVTMPSRVPYGFHGTFIRTEELLHVFLCMSREMSVLLELFFGSLEFVVRSTSF